MDSNSAIDLSLDEIIKCTTNPLMAYDACDNYFVNFANKYKKIEESHNDGEGDDTNDGEVNHTNNSKPPKQRIRTRKFLHTQREDARYNDRMRRRSIDEEMPKQLKTEDNKQTEDNFFQRNNGKNHNKNKNRWRNRNRQQATPRLTIQIPNNASAKPKRKRQISMVMTLQVTTEAD